MNITDFGVIDTATLHLKTAAGTLMFADGEIGKPMRIVFFGPGSDAAARVEERATARATKRMHASDGRYVPLTPEEALSETAEDLADLTAAIENITHPGVGTKGDTRSIALAIFKDRKLGFITNQALKFRAEWGNFTGSSNAS